MRATSFTAALLIAWLVGACGSGDFVAWDGFTDVSATTPLLRGLSQDVDVSATIAAEQAGSITAVTADLSQIGGGAAQPLERDGNTWSWSGKLVPQDAGMRQVTFSAVTDSGDVHQARAEVRVNTAGGGDDGGGDDGDNLPPTITDEVVTTTGVEGVRGATTVSCTATDQDGTVVSVTADLSALNGPDDAALTHGEGDTWSYSGDLVPLQAGELAVPLVATDDDGATGTGEATTTIAPGFELTVGPEAYDIDIFDDQIRTFTATISPTPPPGSTVTYHWTVSTLYLGTLVQVLRLPDAPGLVDQTLDTDADSLRVQVVPQPWSPQLRVPIDSNVRCGATITLPVGEAAAAGGQAEVTISQLGLERDASFREKVWTDIHEVTHRRFEAGFEWPMDGANQWVVAFLDKPNADQTAFNSIWILPQVTVANGGKQIVDDGNAGLLLDSVEWTSDGGSLLLYQQRQQELRDIYTGWRVKVTGWPSN